MATAREQLQAIIDALPDLGNAPEGRWPQAGIAHFPAGDFKLDAPLRLKPGVHAIGEGTATNIVNPTGPCVVNSTDAGNRYPSFEIIEKCFLSSPGDAVLLDPKMDESAGLQIRDCHIRGDVNWVQPQGRASYQALVRDTVFHDRGQIRFKGDMLTIERLDMDFAQDRPFIIAEGNGAIRDSWLEGPGAIVQLKNGVWEWKANHNEPHAAGAQIILDNAVIEADQFYFASPLNPIHLKNGSRVMFTRTLEAKLPAPDGTPTDPAKCYLTDKTMAQKRDAQNRLTTKNGLPVMVNANSVRFDGADVRVGSIA